MPFEVHLIFKGIFIIFLHCPCIPCILPAPAGHIAYWLLEYGLDETRYDSPYGNGFYRDAGVACVTPRFEFGEAVRVVPVGQSLDRPHRLKTLSPPVNLLGKFIVSVYLGQYFSLDKLLDRIVLLLA